jgi:hypothetical protein
MRYVFAVVAAFVILWLGLIAFVAVHFLERVW